MATCLRSSYRSSGPFPQSEAVRRLPEHCESAIRRHVASDESTGRRRLDSAVDQRLRQGQYLVGASPEVRAVGLKRVK